MRRMEENGIPSMVILYKLNFSYSSSFHFTYFDEIREATERRVEPRQTKMEGNLGKRMATSDFPRTAKRYH